MQVTSETVLFSDSVTVGRGKKRRLPVSVQTLAGDEYGAKYCVRYAGNGHYFRDAAGAQQYIETRFKRELDLVAILQGRGITCAVN